MNLKVLPAHEPSKLEIHAQRVLDDMREISAICNATGHHLALWTLLDDLRILAGDIERETDESISTRGRTGGDKP